MAGLALSSAISATVYALLLLLPLQREKILDGGALPDLIKMALSALVMGLCVRAAPGVLSPLLPAGKPGELLCLGLCAGLGVALYFALTLILRVDEAKLVVSLARRK